MATLPSVMTLQWLFSKVSPFHLIVSHTETVSEQQTTQTEIVSESEVLCEPQVLEEKCHIVDLPVDVLYLLADYLPPASIVAAKLTCRALLNTIPVNFAAKTLDRCAGTAIRNHLEESKQAPFRYRCALCKNLYSRALFDKARCLDPNDAHSEPPSRVSIHDHSIKTELQGPRICFWHVPRFVRDLRSPDFRKRHGVRTYLDEPGVWTCHIERACMHCGYVIIGRSCTCSCASCGTRYIRTWTRTEGAASQSVPIRLLG